MALTPRQRQFYEALQALCRAAGRSVHYSTLAEALGVSPFSAYDMLQVLKGKGLAASEYILEAGASGPGRSTVMFYPLPEAAPGAARAAGPEEAEWSRVSQKLLQRLHEVGDSNVREVLNELLGRLSDYGSPLSYCTAVIAALLVNLRLSQQGAFAEQLRALWPLVSAGELGLGALAGLSIGSRLAELGEATALEPLLSSARRFQLCLAALSAESRQKLAGFVNEALAAIETTQAS